MYSIDLQCFKASVLAPVGQVIPLCLFRIYFLYIRLRPLEKKKPQNFESVIVKENS